MTPVIDPPGGADGGRAPPPASATTLRLRVAFGDAALAGLLAGLREQLDAALSQDVRPDEAHRLVGITGSLGFTDLAEGWRAVMDGGGGEALSEARRLSRLAIATIGVLDFVPPRTAPNS